MEMPEFHKSSSQWVQHFSSTPVNFPSRNLGTKFDIFIVFKLILNHEKISFKFLINVQLNRNALILDGNLSMENK